MFCINFRVLPSKFKALSGVLNYNYSCLNSFVEINTSSSISKQKVTLNRIKEQHFLSSSRFQHSCDQKDVKDNIYENVNIEFITNGDKDLEKKLKVLFLEVEVLRHDGQKVPSQLSDEKWKELLSLPSRMQRIKLLSFWWRNEMLRKKDKIKKEVARKNREVQQELESETKTDHIVYGFKGSTIFIRIYDTTIDNQLNYKLINAMMFGQDIVLDCSYDEHMTLKEASLCAKQLAYLFSQNRLHKDPFNVHFCNANSESRVFQKLNKIIPTMYEPTFPLNIYSKHYLELFPKEKLVYLTPHCREELVCYNPDDIYIIGAMVDKMNNEPLSLAKAKAEGLRMAKFPLDRYLEWTIGSKSLTLDQVVKIMLDLKSTNNWIHALQHVPRRKIRVETNNSVLLGGKSFQVEPSRQKRSLIRSSLLDLSN